MIRIYHTSDLHDHRGFVPRLAALRRDRPGLYFDCGDSLRGSQTVYHRDEPVIGELDAAGVAAQSIGNREFHYLFGLLRARAAKMAHPLVCSNLQDVKGRELPFVPSLILEEAGVRIHVVGLLIMQYPVGSPWERIFGWRFLKPWDAIAPYAQGVPPGEMLLVLSHVGLSLDRQLARRLPRIDLLLGGHSHDTLYQPEYVDDVPIVHAGPYGRYVSRTSLDYDTQRSRFTIREFELVPLLAGP
jgi:2',3'-cyclic-nucleotide 2'-phosphodiesterase (5'-nucleotidase family)